MDKQTSKYPKRLDVNTVEQIRKYVASGKSQKAAAIDFKRSEGAISKIVNFKSYNGRM